MSTTAPPAPPAQAPRARQPRRPNLALCIGAVITGLMIIVASLSLMSLFAARTSHSSHSTFASPGSTLTIDTGSADVTVQADDVTSVEVAERDNTVKGEGVSRPTLSGARLHLPSNCRGGGLGWIYYCSVSYVVHVPRATSVDLQTGSGDVHARGISQPLRIQVGSGDVAGSSLTAPTVVVRTGSGDVTLGFLAAPTSVDAHTGSGDLFVGLPRSGAPYRIDESTGSGDYVDKVDTSQSSAHTLTLDTGSGDLEVGYAGS
jgi:hypothetical protein